MQYLSGLRRAGSPGRAGHTWNAPPCVSAPVWHPLGVSGAPAVPGPSTYLQGGNPVALTGTVPTSGPVVPTSPRAGPPGKEFVTSTPKDPSLTGASAELPLAAWDSPRLVTLPGLLCPAPSDFAPRGQGSGQGLVVACLCHPGTSFQPRGRTKGLRVPAQRKEHGPRAVASDSGTPSPHRWVPVRSWGGETPAGRGSSPNLPEPGVRNSGSRERSERGREPAGAQLGPPRRQRDTRAPPPAGGHTANARECMTLSPLPAA